MWKEKRYTTRRKDANFCSQFDKKIYKNNTCDNYKSVCPSTLVKNSWLISYSSTMYENVKTKVIFAISSNNHSAKNSTEINERQAVERALFIKVLLPEDASINDLALDHNFHDAIKATYAQACGIEASDVINLVVEPPPI